jgi:Endonuclease NucS
MINEAKIRDSLATKLHLIEHGLSLEGIESPIKNLQGTSGRLDIYARDQCQHRVVIEIKRTTKASREAIHELYKYVSLLRETYGIKESNIRCILVSTEWEELLVPFSSFVSDSEYEVSGYKAIISNEGEVLFLEPITPLPKSETVIWYEYHSIFFFENENKRNIFIPKIRKILQEIPGIDFVCIPMDYDKSKEDLTRIEAIQASDTPSLLEVIYPFNLYVAKTKIRPKYIEDVRILVGEELLLKIEDEPLEEAVGLYVLEKLEKLGKQYDDWELGYNAKFSNMIHTWHCKDSIRIGEKISNQLFYSELDLQGNILETQGKHPFIYEKTFSPKFENAWTEVKTELSSFLAANSKWKEIILSFLETFDNNIGVLFKCCIYNPCNVMQAIYDANFCFKDPSIPYFLISVEDFSGLIISVLAGHLAWDGEKIDLSMDIVLEHLFKDKDYINTSGKSERDSIARMLISFSKINESEMSLCELHNLKYVATEFKAEGTKLNEEYIWSSVNNTVIKQSYSSSICLNLNDFCREHKNYVNELALLLDGYNQFEWEEQDFYCLEYFENTKIALQSKRFINFSNIQPPVAQYGLGIVERADLVLQYLDSDELSSEDIVLRNKIIEVFILLCMIEPEAVNTHIKLTIRVFGYSGILNTGDLEIKKMWEEIQRNLIEEKNENLIWLISLADAVCKDVDFSLKIKDGMIYKQQGLNRQKIFQKLNSYYSKGSHIDTSIFKMFELDIF